MGSRFGFCGAWLPFVSRGCSMLLQFPRGSSRIDWNDDRTISDRVRARHVRFAHETIAITQGAIT